MYNFRLHVFTYFLFTELLSLCQVLLLSFAFLIVPNFNPFRDGDSMEEVKSIPIPGKSRNLLHKGGDDLSNDMENPYGITIRPPTFWQQGQSAVVSGINKDIIDDIELDGDERKPAIPGGDTAGKDKVVYVQIEQSVVESNVTYVTSEDYKNDHNYDSSVKQLVDTDGRGGKKSKHDL